MMIMREDLPKISIVIPVLNMGRYLRECLTTIKKQKYPNIELIIIDGGSTDNTHEILAQYDDMISILVSEADRGQPDAVTKGLIRATGNIVHWHAADDIVLPGAFKRVVTEFKQHNDIDLVFSDGLGISANGITRGPTVRWVNFIESVLFFGRFQSDCAYWRREVMYDALPLDNTKQITCDEDYFLRMWRGSKYRWINQPLGAFRTHGEQVSQKFSRDDIVNQRKDTRERIIKELGWTDGDVRKNRRNHMLHYWIMNRFAARAYSAGRFLLRKITGGYFRRRYSRYIMNNWIREDR